MSPIRFLRHLTLAVFAAGILALSATDAQASHFRYGTIKWRIINQTSTTFGLEVTAECAWRRSFYNPQPVLGQQNFPTGQSLQLLGTGYGNSTALTIDVTAVNGPPEDWFVGNNTFTFGPIPNGAVTGPTGLRVFWNGNARISTLLDGNADDNFNVEARVSSDLTNQFSPAASLLPIVNIAHGQPAAKFFIPATDPDGDPLKWAISSTARSSLTKAAPDGWPDVPGAPATLGINSDTGEVTWNTAVELAPNPGQELYAVQFLITDLKGGEIPVDALFRLVPNTSQPPSALVDNSPNAAQFDVPPGSPISFVFKGTDPDPNDIVTLAVGGGMPAGATFTPTLPFSGTQPQSSTFNWTPTLADVGSHVISLSVTDNFALQDTNSATITVLPDFQPNATCPGDVTMQATGPLTTYTASVIVDDPEGGAMTVKWSVDGVLIETDLVPASPDPTTVTFTHDYVVGGHLLNIEIRDALTNPVFCNSLVRIEDTTGPVITLPPSQILEATSPAGAAATWSPDPPVAVDLVDGNVPVTCTHASGATFPIFPPPPQDTTTTVTCTAEDLSHNTTTGTFTITVQDTTDPNVTVPANITVEATSGSGAAVNFVPAPSAFDIVDGPITPTCSHASGSTFPLGNTTVTCSATDVHNNTGSAQFIVSVVDTTPPVVTVPGPMLAEATGPGGANVTFVPAPSAFDTVSGNITPTCAPASGSLFPLFPPPPATTTTTVTCSATDGAGNTGTATFTVTIQDTTPPVISNMPANITVTANLPGGANVFWASPTALDLVDGSVAVTCVPPSGSLFPIGTTTVTCTAKDIRNNTSSETFTVTVNLAAPKPCVTLSPGELWPPNHKMVPIDVDVTVPGQPATCTVTSVTSSEPVTGQTYGRFAPDWTFHGLNLELRAERYSNAGRTYTIVVSCTGAGGVGTVTAKMKVPHDQRPHEIPPNTTCAP
jgi:hypothetical protein